MTLEEEIARAIAKAYFEVTSAPGIVMTEREYGIGIVGHRNAARAALSVLRSRMMEPSEEMRSALKQGLIGQPLNGSTAHLYESKQWDEEVTKGIQAMAKVMLGETSPTEWEQDCLKWRGRVLTGKYKHYCYDWDGLPMDETCDEWETCVCWKTEIREEIEK